jgi:peptidoglycan/xylan/chitin deacetylase (PgdA/CDA1 family)
MVFLSFDIEEFDVPLEYGTELEFGTQIKVSSEGAIRILDILQKENVVATFFCTANFAIHAPAIVRRIVDEGHELASHGYFHSQFHIDHLASSKKVLEDQFGAEIKGFRMPRMMHIEPADLVAAGYCYNSSLNPTLLPGRYNNFAKPRRIFREGDLFQIPASVSPALRIPLFWLSLHNLPLQLYLFLSHQAMKKDEYLNVYCHPWEFVDLKHYQLPWYMQRNSGNALATRLEILIEYFKKRGVQFGCLHQCVETFGQ